jgi:hypothetical protein
MGAPLSAPAKTNTSFPRLQDRSLARQYGYTPGRVRRIMRKIASFENRLLRLFGPSFSDLRFSRVKFVERDRRVGSAGIALENVSNLVIDCSKVSPERLEKRLIPYVAHEYGHVLTLKPEILWKSLPGNEKNRAMANFDCVDSSRGLSLLNDRYLRLVFAASLGSGLDNPYISGLKTGGIDITELFYAFFDKTHDGDMSDAMIGSVVKNCVELITDRVADLILAGMPAVNATVREIVRSALEDSGEGLSEQNREWDFPHLMYARLYAEKTGNADLLNDSERIELGPLYHKYSRMLSALWDGMGLKKQP